MKINEQKFRDYLLENLSPAEAEEMDLQVISDVDLAAELDKAETELIEDYLEGTLSAAERGLFEKNFLVTDERRKRLEFLGLLKDYAQKSAPRADAETGKAGIFASLKGFLGWQKLALAGGVIVLLVVSGLFWRAFWTDNKGDPELAVLNQRDLSNPGEFKASSTLVLAPGTLRSGGNENGLETADPAGNVFFRLALALQTPLDSTFRVRFLRDKNVVFTIDRVRIYKNEAGPEMRLLVPARLLPKGEYQIELEKDGAKIVYNFVVR